MIITKLLRPNHPMHIRLHELLDEVNFAKVVEVRRAEDVEDGDDVLEE